MTAENVKTQLQGMLSEFQYMTSREDLDGAYKEVLEANAEALEETLDILQDYEKQARQASKDTKHFHTESRPIRENGAWLCPKCKRKVRCSHSYCYWCGKKLGWRR